MIKPKFWTGGDLKGTWHITLKIDGVRMLRDDKGNPVSRSGKPLYNLDHISKDITDAEIYGGDWESSISLVRTSVNGSPVPNDRVFSLDPIESRLDLGHYEDPTEEFLHLLLAAYRERGYEGLVIRKGNKWLKVKPEETADVRIIGIQEGTKGKKNEGKLGAFITEHGKIGTGFTDELRVALFDEELIGSIVEVKYMELTPGGKMRHARYIRIREDRSDESLPWLDNVEEADDIHNAEGTHEEIS